ncbi:MAG: type IV pilus biogenesis/stability protein PilW [Arenicellales bacterium]|nr:type IV pilus biogenesis/stability protein PilW [Arenicellales bacterium]
MSKNLYTIINPRLRNDLLRTVVFKCLLVFWIIFGIGCETTVTTNPDAVEDWSPAQRADVHAQLAAEYMERNALKTAYKELEEALSIVPSHSRSNYVMAVLQTRLNDYDKANSYYKRALKSDPQNSEAAHDYGIFLCDQGKVEEALQSFEQALGNPLYTGVMLTNLRAGECLITQGEDLDQAENYFKAVLDVNPNISTALYYMAEINYTRGNFLSARGYIERFFSVHVETPESLLLATKIETALVAHDVAEDYARRLKAKFPSSDEVRQLGEL